MSTVVTPPPPAPAPSAPQAATQSPCAIAICSNALLILGAQPITSFDQKTDKAVLAGNLYPVVRDEVLRSHPWNCCIKRVLLNPDADKPLYDYSYQFTKPRDWLRTMSVGDYGVEDDFKSEGDKLLADVNPLKLRYVFRNEDACSYDASLTNVMTLAMAARMAYAVTQSTAKEQACYQELDMAMKAARNADAQDDPPETLGDFRLLASRFTRVRSMI